MASYPGNKVHRTSRRRLGKGQHPQLPAVTITATAATVTVHLVFSAPVVVRGPIPYVTSSGAVSGQTVIDTTHVDLTCTESQAAAAWSIIAGCGGEREHVSRRDHGGSRRYVLIWRR